MTTIFPVIEANLANMTPSEQEVAHYFLKQPQISEDFSAKSLMSVLHISKATLTRFAKKCGFQGYREFIFRYVEERKSEASATFHKELIPKVLSDYDEILQKTYSIINEKQLEQITDVIDQAQRVYLYGKGSSALALHEMKLRFMRLGIICEVISDNDMFLWNNLLLDETCLVMGASISGDTKVVIDALHDAKKQGAKTLLMTTKNMERTWAKEDLLLLASREHLAYGNSISPQFPLLLMIDCLFAYYLNTNKAQKQEHFNQTIITYEEDINETKMD